MTSKKKIVCITPLNHIPSVLHELESHCEVLYRPDIDKSSLRELLIRDQAFGLFVNPNMQTFKIDRELLEGTNVSVVNTASTGTNHIDVQYCKSAGVAVLSLTSDYDLIRQLPSTAELAFGLALSLMRKIPQSFEDVKTGSWRYDQFVGRQLSGLTAGIIGYGRLGTFMARYCHAFGMKVLVNDPYKNVFDYEQVSKDRLLSESDLISLHVHVKEDTFHMIDRDAISRMKKKPFLINTSRGEVVDEDHVASAIEDRSLAGYGTDVLSGEFSTSGWINDSKIVRLSKLDCHNVVITPHIGGMSIEGQEKAFLYAARKFKL